MATQRFAIEDSGIPKAFDDTTLSPRAKEIVKRVADVHLKWIRLATWGANALGRDPKTLTTKEAMAVETYYNLRKKVTWPLWSTRQTDQDVEGLVFAIQATFSRMKRLVPEAFPTVH